MDDTPTAWVVKRSNCTLALAFSAIENRAVAAVQRFNELPQVASRPLQIDTDPESCTFFVQGWTLESHQPVRLFFNISDARDAIHVNCNMDGIPDLRIRQVWDVHQERCVLLAGHDGAEKRERTMEQVTQLGLDPLFL